MHRRTTSTSDSCWSRFTRAVQSDGLANGQSLNRSCDGAESCKRRPRLDHRFKRVVVGFLPEEPHSSYATVEHVEDHPSGGNTG